MARNAEKAMTTLARWRAAKEAESGAKERRPYIAAECKELPKCEKWRLEILREVSLKVAQIQNAGLGEFRLRDLNDEINKLLREKRHWEAQISALGGKHYKRFGPAEVDDQGREVPGNRGYKYFGAAKDLPGVRELFERVPEPPLPRTRGELMKNIDAEYYGYCDDDDGILVPLEERAEREARSKAIQEWKAKMVENGNVDVDVDNSDDEEIYPLSGLAREAAKDAVARKKAADEAQSRSTASQANIMASDPMELLAPRFTAHVPVPTQKDIEEALLRKRKKELLAKYGGDAE